MPEATDSPSGYFNQTFTVEYTIHGSLDGVTLVPDELQAPAHNDDPQQFYRIEVEGNAGLFDVDYLVNTFNRRGAVGTRLIHVTWISSPVAGAVDAEINVVDAIDGPVLVQEAIDSLSGLTTYYRRSPPIWVPQGSLLQISGFTNLGIDTIKVRLTIQFTDDLTAAQMAVCCGTEIPGPTGPAGPAGPAGEGGDEGPEGVPGSMVDALRSLPSGATSRVNAGIPTTVSGTAAQQIPTSTNLLTSLSRTRATGVAGAGQAASWRSDIALWWRGNAAGLGGFNARWRFGLPAFAAGFRAFVGFTDLLTQLPDAEPSALTNIIGIGFDSSSSQWAIMHNDAAGSATIVPLNASFNVAITDLISLQLIADPNAGTVDWVARNVSAGVLLSGTIAADLPAADVFLAHQEWVNTGAIAGTAPLLDLVDIVVVTPPL